MDAKLSYITSISGKIRCQGDSVYFSTQKQDGGHLMQFYAILPSATYIFYLAEEAGRKKKPRAPERKARFT